ncbi:MAG TPA: MbcA/ParS/Xre antitoxin family protein [Pyrinomonadaceae bacterium]|jgi:dsDNA-binding SOS-regulon protein
MPIAVMAKEMDNAEEMFDELLEEAAQHVEPAQRSAFSSEVAPARARFARAIKESRQRIAQAHASSSYASPSSTPLLSEPIMTISSHINAYVPHLGTLKPKWRKLGSATETIERRLDLLTPRSLQALIKALWWMGQRGREEDLDLLQKVRGGAWANSEEVIRATGNAEQNIIQRVFDPDRKLQQFFGVGPAELTRLLGVGRKATTLASQGARESADHLQAIRQSLTDLFEREEIERWLRAPNEMFDGKIPLEAMVGGQLRRVRQLLTRIEEGIPY